MALVDYSSSDEEILSKAAKSAVSHKRKRDNEQEASTSSLPPLPSQFHDLYATSVRSSTQDDPTLHSGRKRVTPHVEGNWPTHVYLEWYPSSTEHTILSETISDLQRTIKDDTNEIHSFLSSDLGATLPLHISISRPIRFLTDKKDSFSDALRDKIKSSGIRPFRITLGDLGWESNFEKTRWFLVLRINAPPRNELNRLLHVVNEIVQDYGQPPLYALARAAKSSRHSGKSRSRLKTDDASDGATDDWSHAFHFSIAWTLNEPNEDLKIETVAINKNCKAELIDTKVSLKEVKNKVGNVVHNLTLATKEFEGGSLFGI